MASWQSYILKALMKLNKFFHRNDQKVDIQEFRDSFEQIGKIAYRKVKGVKETKTTIAGLDAFWFTSEKATNEKPTFFFPRGGYTAGSIAIYRTLVSELAAATEGKVLYHAYRLAPLNTPFLQQWMMR